VGDFSVVRSLNDSSTRVADPVSVLTGEFYANHVDLELKAPLPITIRRTYSTRNSAVNELGYGWLTGYPSYLLLSDDLSTICAADTDGSVVLLRRQGSSADIWSPTIADNPEMTDEQIMIVNLSGRGDKDIDSVRNKFHVSSSR